MAVTRREPDLGSATPYRTGWVPYDLTIKIAVGALFRVHGDHPLRHRPLVMSWHLLSDEQHADMIAAMREDVQFILSVESPYELSKDERSELRFWLSLGDLVTVRWGDCPDWIQPRLPVRHEDDDDMETMPI